MSIPAAILAICALLAAAPSPDTAPAEGLAGTWELTGVGLPDDLAAPERMVLTFDSPDRFRLLVWESGEVAPVETTGRYVVRGEVLELFGPESGAPETFRMSRDLSSLALRPLESARDLPLRFERRAWIVP